MTKRRDFIKRSALISIGFGGLSSYLLSCSAGNQNTIEQSAKSVSLFKEKNPYLDLPAGFDVKVIAKWGDKMSDGLLVPCRADGMATFDIDGKVVIVCNHENSPLPNEFSAFQGKKKLFDEIDQDHFYDYGYGKTPGLGGTTNIWYDENTGIVERHFLTLIGTYRNCAGGKTPWGSWISCEEDVTTKNNLAEKKHGYNFEVSANAQGLTKPIPLKAMGRFNHEAVCVDPRTGIVYQTEDAHDGLIYRFIPDVKGDLQAGGTLQALIIKSKNISDTRNWKGRDVHVGETFEVQWMTMENVDPDKDDLRLRGHQAGATIFARGEGMWFGDNELFFACTNGGPMRNGQVFKYTPGEKEGTPTEAEAPGKLQLFAESTDSNILQHCDNLTVSPWGDVILVEDRKDAHIRGITPEGQIYTIGKNIFSNSELAGICFSLSGKTMFVNIQQQGLTLAVTGDWKRLRNAS